MNQNRETEGFGGTIGSEVVAADVVQGWGIRNHGYNSIATVGLVPFVQLIGLYSKEEVDKLINKPENVLERQAVYVDDAGREISSWDGPTEEEVSAELESTFEEQIRSKYIQINIKNYNQRADDAYTPGIILATNASQVGDEAFETYENNIPKDSGGVGITDLQIETGTKEFSNRRYKLRLTVTDPFVLNDKKEYLKLSTLQSQFLLIHGWANPHDINGMDQFDPPPKITDVGLEGFPNGRMSVDLTNPNTGGMWSAATVAITMFDFAFNEQGQLEASFTFMPREISFASTYRIPTVSSTMKLFLGTGEEGPQIDNENPTAPTSTFAGLIGGFGSVMGEFGKNLADVIYEEQQAYVNSDAAIAGLFSNLSETTDFSVTDSLRNFSEQLSQWDVDLGTTYAQTRDQKYAEGNYRFPYAGPGIRVYREAEIEVADPNDITQRITKKQTTSQIAYYYLGWLLEAMRFSMWDLNKDRVKNGQKPFDFKFKYYNVPEDSQFNLAFQDQINQQTMRQTSDIVSEMIKSFKENNTPIFRPWNPILQEANPNGVAVNVMGQKVKYEDGVVPDFGIFPESIDAIPITAIQIRDAEDNIFVNEISRNLIRPLGGGSFNRRNVTSRPYQIIGNMDEEPWSNWQDLTLDEKFAEFKSKGVMSGINGVNPSNPMVDYRLTLVETDDADPAGPGLVRIMHPNFEGQLLYNWVWVGKVLVDITNDGSSDVAAWRSGRGNGPIGAGPPSLGSASDLGFITSKVNNFFVGEFGGGTLTSSANDGKAQNVARLTDDSLGIIMPAVSARYYSRAKYSYAQQTWYNRHIKFLHNYFSSVIRERVNEVTLGGGNVNSIRHEPIDLFWLTGRKYKHYLPLWFKKSNDGDPLSMGTGSTIPNYDESGSPNRGYDPNAYKHSRSIIDIDNINFNKIVVDEEARTEEQTNTLITEYNNKQREFERILNGRSGGENNLNRDQGYGRTNSRLRRLESTGNIEEIKSYTSDVAKIIKQYTGLNGELAFYNEKISNILVELYNKDLINLPSESIQTTARFTLAGKLKDVYEQSDLVAGRNMIESTEATSFGNIEERTNGYILKFYGGAPNDAIGIQPYPEGRPARNISFREWGEIRNVQYANPTTNGRLLQVNYQDADRYPLALDTVDQLGRIDINSDYGIEYIYMNFIPPSDRDQWTSGYAIKEAADNNDRSAMMLINIGEGAYRQFINRNRGLMTFYLTAKNRIEEEIRGPQGSFDKYQAEINQIIQERDDINYMQSQLENREALSPFSPSNPLDTTVTIPRGGGRSLSLDGIVAQQWALRFDSRTVYGTSDIKNYRVRAGGIPVFDPTKSTYGWGNNVQPRISRPQYELAKLDNITYPKKILDIDRLATERTYEWNGSVYNVRGARGAQTSWINGQPNALIWDHPNTSKEQLFYSDTTDAGFGSRFAEELRVEYLVRAGFVDVDLIKELLEKNYGWNNVGFTGDEGKDQYIVGHWPLYPEWLDPSLRNESDRDLSYYIGPAYLVDEDLDFVVQPKTVFLSSAFDDEGRLNTTALMGEYYHRDDWVKMGNFRDIVGNRAGLAFAPIPEGILKMYPTQREDDITNQPFRLNYNDHLPALTINQVRRAVQKFNIDPLIATYSNAGRPARNSEYPLGIPNDLEGNPIAGSNSTGYREGKEGVDMGDKNSYTISEWHRRFDFPRGSNSSAYSDLLGIEGVGVSVNDILNTLPDDFERGFFSSVAFADADFNGGTELNEGLTKFIAEEFIHLFQNDRRVAVRSEKEKYHSLNNMLEDVTYGDLIEEPDDLTSMADFSNQKIKNVAEIPIKREVVDNLLSRRNSNMSLIQFMQQILSPNAIGLAGNVQLGVRNTNGIVDIIPASISYKQQTTDFFKEQLEKEIADAQGNDYDMSTLLFEYKKRNSLVENIDMSSKMDPAAFLTYQNSSDLLMGRDYNVLKLLSYEGVAEDFKEFLDGTQRADNSGQTYSGIITIGENNKVRVNKVRFDELPSSIVDSMISQNPERWAKITSMMQGNNNFTTELLAFYMRSVTITIHGTTSIQPFNLINVTGVMPDLEGVYIITNLTEKVTPTTFQTVLEGKLLKRKRLSDDAYI